MEAIIPAILKTSFTEIADAAHSVSDFAAYVQIDIVDGLHAPDMTWPYTTAVIQEEIGRLDNLPVTYELDLMIEKPERTLGLWLSTGAKRCIIHLTSTERLSECVRRVKEAGKEVYIGVTIADNLSALEPVINEIDGVQCMGIAHIGRQGEPFDDRVLALIRTVKDMKPALPINADGGVSINTAPMFADAGVSQFAVGSALFQGDRESNFLTLTEITRRD